MGEENYKSSKEAFVSGATGSSITHVNLVSAAALCSLALYLSARKHNVLPKKIKLLTEWSLLVLPLLLSMTLFANKPILLCLLLLLPLPFVPILAPKRDEPPPLSPIGISRPPWPANPAEVDAPLNKDKEGRKIIPLPALTIYRAHMLLMTFFAILAVDFPVFPRALAKCETFGVSLMDIGVGSFVFSQGVISAIPVLKDPVRLMGPTFPKLRITVRKVLPMIVLGVVRVISVKGTDYPEHETEYGTHWNFFFTMAILPIMEVVFHPLLLRMPISLLGFLVAIAQQLTLNFGSMQHYALHAPRTSLISANKEGLVSLPGYFAIHLLGLSLGTVLLPSSPGEFRHIQTKLSTARYNKNSDRSNASIKDEFEDGDAGRKAKASSSERQDDKTVTELFSYSTLWWVCTGLCYMINLGDGVSRRLANMPYVLWIAAYNTSFIMLYLLLDLLYRPQTKKSRRPQVDRRRSSSSSLHPASPDERVEYAHHNRNQDVSKAKAQGSPALLEAINKNGLVLFLLANVATGLVNLSMKTMYASDTRAMFVLSLYSFGLCSIAWVFREKKVVRL